jgi:hypothetical protein
VLSTATIGRILEGGAQVCRSIGIPIAGGHTIDSVEAIYGLVVIGLIHPKQVKRNADARAGDLLVLSKPLGVGVLSAALKKNLLDPDGYAQMIETTTRLNTPGPDLAAIDGVHALTDVTGFGLAGHTLELARGAQLQAQLDWAQVPLLDGVLPLLEQGCITGASGRNWAGYGAGTSAADRPANQRWAAGELRASGLRRSHGSFCPSRLWGCGCDRCHASAGKWRGTVAGALSPQAYRAALLVSVGPTLPGELQQPGGDRQHHQADSRVQQLPGARLLEQRPQQPRPETQRHEPQKRRAHRTGRKAKFLIRLHRSGHRA